MSVVNSKLKFALAGLLLASAALSAQAEVVKLTYNNPNTPFTESFDLNTTAGFNLQDVVEVLFFNITNDTAGNLNFAIGSARPAIGPSYYSEIVTGNLDGTTGPGGSFGDYVFSASPLYDGVNLVLNVAPGQVYSTYGGGTLTVSAVPEVSTWAMMLSGFAALGFATYRRRVAA